jgi:invasion protein IalB
MKVSMIALTFAALTVAGVAHAANPAADSATTIAKNAAVQTVQTQWSVNTESAAPKTRAQVRQELVQAEQDGQLARLNQQLYSGS